MEEKDLKLLGMFGVGIILLALIVTTGLIVMNKFDYQLRSPTTTDVQDLLIVPEVTSGVLVGSSGTYPYLAGLTGCVNNSNGEMFNSTYYTISEGDANGGYLTLKNITVPEAGAAYASGNWTGMTVNCTVSYRASNASSNATSAFSTGLATFATFVGLIVLAYLGKIIIRMFKKGL